MLASLLPRLFMIHHAPTSLGCGPGSGQAPFSPPHILAPWTEVFPGLLASHYYVSLNSPCELKTRIDLNPLFPGYSSSVPNLGPFPTARAILSPSHLVLCPLFSCLCCCHLSSWCSATGILISDSLATDSKAPSHLEVFFLTLSELQSLHSLLMTSHLSTNV